MIPQLVCRSSHFADVPQARRWRNPKTVGWRDSLQGMVAGCYVVVACKISQGWKCDRIEKLTLAYTHGRRGFPSEKLLLFLQVLLPKLSHCLCLSSQYNCSLLSPPTPHPTHTHTLYPLISLSPHPSLSQPFHPLPISTFSVSLCVVSLCVSVSVCVCLCLCLSVSVSLLKRSSSALSVSLSASPLPVCLTLCVSLSVSV